MKSSTSPLTGHDLAAAIAQQHLEGKTVYMVGADGILVPVGEITTFGPAGQQDRAIVLYPARQWRRE